KPSNTSPSGPSRSSAGTWSEGEICFFVAPASSRCGRKAPAGSRCHGKSEGAAGGTVTRRAGRAGHPGVERGPGGTGPGGHRRPPAARAGLAARRAEPLAELHKLITTAGGSAAVVVADVADRSQVEAAFREVRDRLGPIDLVIANAGVGKPTLLDPVNVADVEDMIRVNVLGVIYTLSAALPEMLARRSRHLVAVSSLAGCRGPPRES